jgi:hypothetical protein
MFHFLASSIYQLVILTYRNAIFTSIVYADLLVNIHIYAYIHTHTHIRTSIHPYVRTYIHPYIHTYVCAFRYWMCGAQHNDLFLPTSWTRICSFLPAQRFHDKHTCFVLGRGRIRNFAWRSTLQNVHFRGFLSHKKTCVITWYRLRPRPFKSFPVCHSQIS